MSMYFIRIHNYLIKTNGTFLVLGYILVNMIISLSFSLLSYLLTKNGLKNPLLDSESIKYAFFVGVIAAPILETIIFQYAIIETAKPKLKPQYTVLLSALIFAVFHLYSLYYFLFAFTSGLLLAYLYYLRKSPLKSCLLIIIAHVLYNFLVFTFKYL